MANIRVFILAFVVLSFDSFCSLSLLLAWCRSKIHPFRFDSPNSLWNGVNLWPRTKKKNSFIQFHHFCCFSFNFVLASSQYRNESNWKRQITRKKSNDIDLFQKKLFTSGDLFWMWILEFQQFFFSFFQLFSWSKHSIYARRTPCESKYEKRLFFLLCLVKENRFRFRWTFCE